MSHALARRKFRRGLALVAAAVALTMAGCSASPESAPSASTHSGDGVIIEHGLGETLIPETPKRVVALGWMTPDIVAALGTNPVGVEEVWGADESGFQPWFKDFVTEEYGSTPEIIPFTDNGPNYEAIKALKPDLILSLYSGLSDIEYGRLSEIAPTVPYVEGPWNPGTWEGMTRTVGKALSADAKAEELIAETEAQITSLAEAHPEFKGKTFVWGLTLNEGGTDLGVYLEYDPRVRITEALGFSSTPAMDSFLASAEDDNWYTGVSLEKLYDVEADLFGAWGGSVAEGKYTVENKVISRWNPIANGSYVIYADQAQASAISAPTVLSLKTVLPGYVDDLAAALQGKPTISGE